MLRVSVEKHFQESFIKKSRMNGEEQTKTNDQGNKETKKKLPVT